jgi:DNA-binding response OmpR family regulator
MRVLVIDDSTTVRRVVSRTLTEAGYEAHQAADGREGLEMVQRLAPDLVLLDYVMPHMDGLAFMKALRGIHNLRHVPVVLMSARADRLAESFCRDTGALDAISKPFGPDALLAMTANALDRARRAARESAGEAEPESTESWLEDETRKETAPETMERVRTEAAEAVAKHLAAAIGPLVRAMATDGLTAPSDAELAQEIVEELPRGAILGLAQELRALVPGDGGEVSFTGRLDHIALGEVLQMLSHQRQTGVLEVRHGERIVAVCVRQGLLDLALGRGSGREFLLGRYLLEEELVDREDLDALTRRGAEKHLLGRQLVKLGYIRVEDLRRALARQSSELLYEALRWRDGTFRFERFATLPEATDARLELPIASMLMEGLRRVDEWRLIEEQIKSFDAVFVRRRDALASVSTDDFSREERAVLGAIDGEHTVKQIVEQTAMSSFDVCKILFQLVTSGLVHERR